VEEARGISISSVEYVGAAGRHHDEFVAVTLHDESSKSSRCMLINAETGVVNPPQEHLDLPGKVVSICRTSAPLVVSSWTDQTNTSAALHLMFLLEDGRTFQSSTGRTNKERSSRSLSETESTTKRSLQPIGSVNRHSVVPSIPFLSDHTSSHFDHQKKRKYHAMTASELSLLHSSGAATSTGDDNQDVDSSNKKQLLSVEHFGHVEGDQMEAELPLLRGTFARAFLARHLFKKDE